MKLDDLIQQVRMNVQGGVLAVVTPISSKLDFKLFN